MFTGIIENIGLLVDIQIEEENIHFTIQSILANELKISEQLLSRWETNKEIPTNKDIANIEKILKIKLPRTKKIKQDL